MSESVLWARTQDQIELLYEARRRGDLCAACGRPLEPGETIYFERFVVGPKRSGYRARDSYRQAPVGRECAAPDLVERAGTERCAGCGRGVIYSTEHDVRRHQAVCSTHCRYRASKAAEEGRQVAEQWGARLKRLREARGMSRPEFAVALAALGRRTEDSEIAKYEEYSYYPRVPTFAALARVLGVSMEVLLYGEEEAERIAAERAPTDT